MEALLPSYNKVWLDYFKTQNLTPTIDLLVHLPGPLSRACNGKNLNNKGLYHCLGEGRESEKQWGTAQEMCMHSTPLGYQNPWQSRAADTAGLSHRLPPSQLKA